MTEAYEDRKAYAIKLYNELVEERLSQHTKAFKVETLAKELQEAKNTTYNHYPDQDDNKAEECLEDHSDGFKSSVGEMTPVSGECWL